MFREMRRIRQKLTEKECVRILTERNTAVLSVYGDDGYPYGVPINFTYADGKIYFHGAKVGHKADALEKNDKVSLCVIDRDDVDRDKMTTLFKSVIVFGRCHRVTGDEEVFHAAKIFGSKYNDSPIAVENEIRRE